MAFRYNNYGLIVSIDFGTTFSGTCYAYTGKFTPKELRDTKYPSIIHITDWPDQGNLSKTPSINIYDRNFHLLHWGMSAFNIIKSDQLQDGHRVIEKFKLDLPSSIAQKGAIHQTGNTSQKELLNMRATIDYFREIFDHTVSTMQKESVKVANGYAVEKENIRFVITVPAQWNDVQRAIMRNVAKEAGLITEDDHENRLLVINESLAATLHCEREKVNVNNSSRSMIEPTDNDTTDEANKKGFMMKNDKYMICDAGGGTVDIAVFESTGDGDDSNNDSFRRCQITADSGKKCGSVFLDQRMESLLLYICFGFRQKSDDTNETGKKSEDEKEIETERKRLKSVIAPLIEYFLGLKVYFGNREGFKQPACPHSDAYCLGKEFIYDSGSDEEDELPDVCQDCDIDNKDVGDAMYVQDDTFCKDTIFYITTGRILKQLKVHQDIEGVTVTEGPSSCEIRITYKCMRENVFDGIINSTLDLLRRQIKKANGGIRRTYLVGGFGGSPYLRKRIKKDLGPDVGELVDDYRGNTAAMRGALIYGIDGSRKDPQSDVVVDKYYDGENTFQYNTLVCLDIGYNGTACAYRDLRSSDDEMIEITNWPGLNKENFMIPTAKETANGETLWGAQVTQTTDLDPELLIIPSELMSIVKSDFRTYLSEYLKLVFEHVYSIIIKYKPDLADKSKYRYVITMENCYQFFNNKSEMRKIAQIAGLINEEDSVKRLLLIPRDNAAAIFFEKTEFPEEKAHSNHFLQISVYHDTCHLSLHESTKISGYDKDIDTNTPNSESAQVTTSRFRNVRSMRSATFTFNFVAKLVANLDSFVSDSVCISCNNPSPHDAYSSTYYSELRDGFLEYMKNTLNFNNKDKLQTITITKSKCCEISITIYDLLEHVFRPATRDLASEINRFATQVDMSRLFNFDKIFLSGFLVEAKEEAYNFLEDIILKNISEVMNIQSKLIQPSEKNGKEALIGAAHYGNFPEDFTERISRKSYVIQVRGFKPQEFSQEVKNNIAEIEKKNQRNKKNDIYNEEATNALIDQSRKVQLYYQSSYNPSLKNDNFIRNPTDVTFLIHRGDKISEHNQMHGVSKRFYAQEECIVYATIYYSEDTDLPEDEVHVDLTKFNKIHQFEIYVKRDQDDPMTAAPDSRLHFDVRIIPDNNEAKFEANVGSRLGSKIPEFRFRDEILVANIYGDKEQIKVEDLTLDKEEKNIVGLGVGQSQ